MTTTASVLAMLLDQAFDDKGQWSIRTPIKFFRERFFDTEWKKDYAWRPFLDPLIIGLGDQQLITGYAVLLSGWIKVRVFTWRVVSGLTEKAEADSVIQVAQNSFEVQGAHFVLILYICALSSSSHLAALITLRKYFRRYQLIAKIRMTLVIVFALFLLCSMIAAISIPTSAIAQDDGVEERQERVQRLSFLVPMIFIIFGFSTALACILHKPRNKSGIPSWNSTNLDSHGHGKQKSMFTLVHHLTDHGLTPTQYISVPANIGLKLLYYLFLNPLITFAFQILLAVLAVILVLSQKFAVPDDKQKWCGLNDQGENVWGFGQTLSMVMLLLPSMSAAQTFLEGRQDIQDRKD
jgi:hypothetical protein